MDTKEKIKQLIRSKNIINLQLARVLCEANNYLILIEVCDFLIHRIVYKDYSDFADTISFFLLLHMDLYPEHTLGFDSYDPTNENYAYEQSVPEYIGILKHLKFLNISRMCLSKLPESFAALQQLEKLDIWLFHVDDIPPILLGLSHLRELNFTSSYHANFLKEKTWNCIPERLEVLRLGGKTYTFPPR